MTKNYCDLILSHYPGYLRNPTKTFRFRSKTAIMRRYCKYSTAMTRETSIPYAKYNKPISHEGAYSNHGRYFGHCHSSWIPSKRNR